MVADSCPPRRVCWHLYLTPPYPPTSVSHHNEWGKLLVLSGPVSSSVGCRKHGGYLLRTKWDNDRSVLQGRKVLEVTALPETATAVHTEAGCFLLEKQRLHLYESR